MRSHHTLFTSSRTSEKQCGNKIIIRHLPRGVLGAIISVDYLEITHYIPSLFLCQPNANANAK
jgi:hypothetical protein